MIIRKNKNIETQEIEDEIVCFVKENDSIICLDQHASLIWKILDKSETFDEIVRVYYELFEEKPEIDIVKSDVDDILSECVRVGLVNIELKEE